MAAKSSREFVFTQVDFDRISKLIYGHAGIVLTAAKQDMVYSRLTRRLRELQLKTFGDYLARLERGDRAEWEIFVNSLTTNLTSFFRESHHFDILNAHLRKLTGKNPIKIWCCAASTGEEPYSIAMTVAETYNSFNTPVSIVATDLDTNVLATAAKGVYGRDHVDRLLPGRLSRFFLKNADGEGTFTIRPELRRMINFQQLNLLSSNWNVRGPLDALFCRNVMIYFDKPTQYKILTRFAPLMDRQGLLFAGHSESFLHGTDLFRSQGRTVYELANGKAEENSSNAHPPANPVSANPPANHPPANHVSANPPVNHPPANPASANPPVNHPPANHASANPPAKNHLPANPVSANPPAKNHLPANHASANPPAKNHPPANHPPLTPSVARPLVTRPPVAARSSAVPSVTRPSVTPSVPRPPVVPSATRPAAPYIGRSSVVPPTAPPVDPSTDSSTSPASGTGRLPLYKNIIFVGASTGGTEAIKAFLMGFPADCPPTMFVQHMPSTFTGTFAARLDGLCQPRVIEAQGGELLVSGTIYLAPGHSHMRIRRSGTGYATELLKTPPVNRHRPSVDVLFDSAAEIVGRDAVGVILTGMGKDGAQGLLRMRQAGARTFGQDAASCVVYGMPREAALIGAVEEAGDLATLAKKALAVCRII